MSKFFDSDLVRNDMKELENMQKKLYQEMIRNIAILENNEISIVNKNIRKK